MAEDVEHFFIYLLAICISSFEKCLFSSFAHLLIVLFALLVFNFFLRQGLTMQPWLVWNSLYSQVWPQTHTPVSASQVLGLEACATMFG
jgi:hypothetical protein